MPALVQERQFRVVDTQAVQDRCVQVVRVDRILGDVLAVVVGRAVGDSRFDASTENRGT
jgi:hypothetical protein